jgi:hypothetical protein
MTVEKAEILAYLRAEVANCKGLIPEAIPINDPILEVIGLLGDDFMAIAAHAHKKFHVHPSNKSYHSGMTIEQWAELIKNEMKPRGGTL